MEHTSDSKMQLVGRGDLVPPGTCMVCGSGNYDYGYIDMGVWFEFHGNAYLCLLCLAEAGNIVGMLTSEEAKRLAEQSGAIAKHNAVLTKELEEANARLRVFDDAMRSIADRSGSVSSITTDQGLFHVGTYAPADSGEAGEPESEESAKGSKRSRPNRIKLSDITEPVGDDDSGSSNIL